MAKKTPWKQQQVKVAQDINSMITAYLAIYLTHPIKK